MKVKKEKFNSFLGKKAKFINAKNLKKKRQINYFYDY
jgi:hypothetical protein